MAILFDGNTPIQGVTAIDDTIIMSGYEYSEDEICVGCWTNGKPIYRKTVQTTSPSSADTYTNIYRIDNTMEIINFYGCLKDGIEGTTFPLNHYRNNTYYSWTIKTSSGIDMVVGAFNNYFINKPVYLTIEYTKTTDAENSFTVDMLYKTQTPFTGAELISDAYNPNSTYVVGDFCIHDNKLYKCNTAITVAEEWNSAHWTETKIGNEVGGSGGSSPVKIYENQNGEAGNITLTQSYKDFDYLIFVWGVNTWGNTITQPVYYKLVTVNNKIYCGLLGNVEKRYSPSVDGLTLTEESGQSDKYVYEIYGCMY